MKCLVTGCAGFIGSHLCDSLLAQGYQVVGVDAFTPYYAPSLKQDNLTAANRHPRFQLIRADLNQVNLDGLLEGVDIIFHLAGQPGVRKSWGTQFTAYATNNILATERLLHACVGRSLQRFVYASSSSIYGDAPDLPWREDTRPRPRSPYAITKLAAEHLCRAYWLDFDVPTVALRYFTVYGPRQRPDMAFHRFIRAILAGRPLTLFGDGTQTRDFTYVDDIVTGTIAAATAENVVGKVFNLGGGSRISLNDLLEILQEVVGKTIMIERHARQAGDVRHTWADTRLATRYLGFAPQVTLRDGLAREYAWLQKLVGAGDR
ncbi:MAG: NAD-dependent epimerase/dehydratase family protein [Chloroflexi bacterium]|nr:MAG: NAD-dependent epimerase/dehydratase family protein [Chloroflexota bacterium]